MTPFPGVKLGPLVGKGSFGKVYRGIWNNDVVAIKVCRHCMLRFIVPCAVLDHVHYAATSLALLSHAV